MTEKSERLVVYVDPSTKQAVENQAESLDESVAEFGRKAITYRLKAEQQDEILQQTNAEQRIEALIAEATDSIQEVNEDFRDLLAKTGVYTIGNWELVKRDYSDQQRQAALSAGSRRLRKDMDVLDLDTEKESTQRHEPPSFANIDDGDDSDDSDDSSDLDSLLGSEDDRHG